MIGIIQFRTDKSIAHEQQCFRKYLPNEDIEFLSVFTDKAKVKDVNHLKDRYDRIIFAGSSELLLSRDDLKTMEAKETIMPTVNTLVEDDFPTLGICFGHQLISTALGGKVARKHDSSEGGIQKVLFTNDGGEESLFKDLGESIAVTQGHDDSVVIPPKGVKHLAFSDRCDFQAMRVGNNVYGFQFHPELVEEDLYKRFEVADHVSGAPLPAKAYKRNHGPEILNRFTRL